MRIRNGLFRGKMTRIDETIGAGHVNSCHHCGETHGAVDLDMTAILFTGIIFSEDVMWSSVPRMISFSSNLRESYAHSREQAGFEDGKEILRTTTSGTCSIVTRGQDSTRS